MTQILQRISFLLWTRFRARKLAVKFRNATPNCGMARQQYSIVLFTDRYVYVSGLVRPCFRYFHGAQEVRVWIEKDGRLTLQRNTQALVFTPIEFTDREAKPVADILRGLNGFFPFSPYSPLTEDEIKARHPKVVG